MLTTIRHLVFATFFVAAVSAPWVVNALHGPDPARDLEVSRPRAEKPSVEDIAELESFPERYGAWLDDSFGLRSRLLRLHNVLKLLVLGVSPSENLFPGKNGWIFATDDHVVENHRGVMPMVDEDLEHWRAALEERRDWLASRGSRYVLFMPPDKHGIYAEMLPDAMRRAGAVSRYRQWLPFMQARSDVEIVDLYRPLEAAKDTGRLVYFPLGTHWTIPGAFVGSNAVIERVAKWFPGMRPQSPEEFTVVSTTDHPGDSWGGKLLIEDLLHQPVEGLERHAPLPFTRVDGSALAARHGVHVTVTVHEDQSLPSAVMFHDSFAPAMMDFLSCHFSRVAYFWSPVFKHEVLEDERPDVVLHERVERFLAYLPPRLPPRLRREVTAWERRGSPQPGDDLASGFSPATYFNPGVGAIELLVEGGLRLAIDGEVIGVRPRSRRVLEDERGRTYAIDAGDGATMTILENDVSRRAYRSLPEDAANGLGRFAGDYRGAGLTFQVRCLGGRLVVFAREGVEASVLVGAGPRFAVADKPGVTVVFSDDGTSLRLEIGESDRLDALKVEEEKGD